MRAIAIQGSKGPATAMYVTDIARPVPIPGQVLVKIRAFGLNRMDILQREGLYPLPSYAPETMGVEFSGVIEQLGDEATAMESGFKCGDEVFGLAYGGTYISHGTGASGFCHWAKSGWGFVRNQQHNQKAYGGRTGAYAEYIVVSTKTLFHKPAQLSWEEAAGIPETWMTATQALLLIGEFQSGQSVLWHAGASSVSIAGIQLAKARGASAIYATAGSPEKIHFLEQELGVTKAFNYKTDKWAAELQKLTTGVNLVVDFIGAPYFQNNLDIAARDGRIILLGLMGGAKLPEGVNIAPLLYKRLRLEASGLRSRDLEYQKTLRDMLVDYALPKFCDRSFKVHIEKPRSALGLFKSLPQDSPLLGYEQLPVYTGGVQWEVGNFHVHSDKDQELSAGQIAIEPRTNKSVCACGGYGIDVGTEGYLDLMDGDTRITTLHFDSPYQSNTNTFQAMETNNSCLVE
ncbi:quinone oxidoreductase [Aspergillus flavus]|nr:quinone oxidoreductase [Aspergillus flavus]